MGMDGNWSELGEWSWELKDFEKTSSWGSTVEVRGCVFRIWLKQISLGLNRQRWVDILDTKGGHYSMEGGHYSIIGGHYSIITIGGWSL